MIKIMFVCHGNICRSPMAEFVMKELVRRKGLENEFVIASSATSTEEIYRGVGNPIYPPAQRELTKRKIPFDTGKRAVQLTKSDYDKYDMIIAMDTMNIRNIRRIIPSDRDNKINKLMDHTAEHGDVADPWYSGDFDTAFNDIYEGCTALLNELTDEK